MKIAHVTASLSRQGAGVRSVIIGLGQAQARLGADVHVFGLQDPEFEATDHADWGDLPMKGAPVTGPKSIGYAPQLLRNLREWQPDLVHLHGLWMHPSAGVNDWHRSTGLPYLISTHGMLSQVALSYSPAKKRLASWLYQDRAFKEAAGIFATSQTEEAEIRDYGLKNPVYFMANGVDVVERPKFEQDAERRREVVSLGRIHIKKGLDLLLDAWARIEGAFPDWQLRLIGPDESGHAGELRERADRLGLSNVSIEGPIYGAARDALLAKADLFVLPTRSENFALTVAESLMMETPVISSKGAPWAGLEYHKCGLWRDLDPVIFAQAMEELMQLPDTERSNMGARGREWVIREYSWTEIARGALESYGQAYATSKDAS